MGARDAVASKEKMMCVWALAIRFMAWALVRNFATAELVDGAVTDVEVAPDANRALDSFDTRRLIVGFL